jgi:hypothetical protein
MLDAMMVCLLEMIVVAVKVVLMDKQNECMLVVKMAGL